MQDYAFDIKYLEGTKLKVSDALSRLYIEEKHKITDVIPLNFLLHTAEPFIHLQYVDSTNELYAHKAISTKIVARQDPGPKRQKKQKVPAEPIVLTVKQQDKSCMIAKRPKRKTTKDDKSLQIQDIVPLSQERMQETVTNNLINPDLKTLFDINSDKQVISTVKNPDIGMLAKQWAVILMLEKVTIYRRHIPHQVEIDRALTELRTKVIRQLVVNFETADLIREYDRSAHFKDIYAYIVRDKLPGSQQVQRRVLGESANYIIANKLMFKLEKLKEGKDWQYYPVLVVLEMNSPKIPFY